MSYSAWRPVFMHEAWSEMIGNCKDQIISISFPKKSVHSLVQVIKL